MDLSQIGKGPASWYFQMQGAAFDKIGNDGTLMEAEFISRYTKTCHDNYITIGVSGNIVESTHCYHKCTHEIHANGVNACEDTWEHDDFGKNKEIHGKRAP